MGSERRETEQGRAAMDAALDVDKGRLPAPAARGRARSAPRSGRGRTMVDRDIPRASVRGDVRRAALIGGTPRAPTPVEGWFHDVVRNPTRVDRASAEPIRGACEFPPVGWFVDCSHRSIGKLLSKVLARLRHFSSKSTLASPGRRVSEEARFVVYVVVFITRCSRGTRASVDRRSRRMFAE